MSCTVEWKCSIGGQDHKGELAYPDISSDDVDIAEDAELTFKTERSKSGATNTLLKKYWTKEA